MLSDLLAQPAALVAPRLLGAHITRKIDGQLLRARIVEVEAYDQADAASHSFRGQTPRTEVMFGAAGKLYVYFTYGMHYCCNIVTGLRGQGEAVLIRAVEPIDGIDIMSRNRPGQIGNNLTNGPAKFCQAFAIDMTWNGHDLASSPIQLVLQNPLSKKDIIQTTRIGIRQAQDTPWRFYIRDNVYVSKPAIL